MFALKPKSTQNNPSAIFYKRCFDLTQYMNASCPLKTLSNDNEINYWVYDKEANKMVLIENKDYTTFKAITTNVVYSYGNNLIAYNGIEWIDTIYLTASDIKINYNKFYDNIETLTNNPSVYLPVIKSLIMENISMADDILSELPETASIRYITIEFENTFDNIIINSTSGTQYLTREINGNTQVILASPTSNNFGVVIPNHTFDGKKFSVSNVVIGYVSNNTNQQLTLSGDDLTNFIDNAKGLLGLLFNTTIIANGTSKIINDKIGKQQRSYFINSGTFNYCYIGDINNVEEQYIKGLNVEYITFDIKTETDLPLNDDDIAIIDGVPYIISDISYKTIRLPKPLRYTYCTLTELKR